ncbi:hypothetical protein TSUD_31960 [Trifolium subterraneum]|uniref:Uncharacterized protein n=1 Tax=Trifolium subterraneum TaxID=3900 RepID=A0A2Z6NCM0_TRISU|nr:hypothetical protein TSUD_31960 [Trifolium subterraneum]
MASQMPETEGRKSLRERNEELEQEMSGLKDDGGNDGNEEVWREEEESKVAGLRLWMMDMVQR